MNGGVIRLADICERCPGKTKSSGTGSPSKKRKTTTDVTEGETDGEVCSDDGSVVPNEAVIAETSPEGDEIDITAANFVQVAESLLEFNGYLNQDEFWARGDHGSMEWFRESCGILLRQLKESCPRLHGNGWKLAKIHGVFIRFVTSIMERGAPLNICTQVFERGLSTWAITPAQNTNRQSHAAVQKRAALNLDEQRLVDDA